VSDRVLRVAIGVLSLAGAAIATYLLYARYTHVTIACSTGGCETVQSSSYATVLGVPVAGVALVGFLAILGTALSRSDAARAAGAGLALCALLFSGYLLVVQLVVIEAVCDWCVASDVIVTALAVLAPLRMLPRLRPAGATP
jgi:uncharacterized membrane protein